MHFKNNIFFAIIVFFFSWSNAQTTSPKIEWYKIYGSGQIDYAYSIIQMPSKFIYIAGSTSLFPGHRTAMILKLDQNGDTLWRKLFDFPGYHICWAKKIFACNDSQMKLLCTLSSDSPVLKNNFALLTIDEEGNKISEIELNAECLSPCLWSDAYVFITTKDSIYKAQNNTNIMAGGLSDLGLNKYIGYIFSSNLGPSILLIANNEIDSFYVVRHVKTNSLFYETYIISLNSENMAPMWHSTLKRLSSKDLIDGFCNDSEYNTIFTGRYNDFIAYGVINAFGICQKSWTVIPGIGKNIIQIAPNSFAIAGESQNVFTVIAVNEKGNILWTVKPFNLTSGAEDLIKTDSGNIVACGNIQDGLNIVIAVAKITIPPK